jgi:hypothetical protein
MIGRLLEELSWVGHAAKLRQGGRGLEDVLTAEVLLALDLLPRASFLGRVLGETHGGSSDLRHLLVNEVEDARLELLPGERFLSHPAPTDPDPVVVQPDAFIETPSALVLVEAKRLKAGAFQSHQLARELILSMKLAGTKSPGLLLVLPKPPPIPVKRHPAMSIPEAVALHLDKTLQRTVEFEVSPEAVRAAIATSILWTTWDAIGQATKTALAEVAPGTNSMGRGVQRTANLLLEALGRHR